MRTSHIRYMNVTYAFYERYMYTQIKFFACMYVAHVYPLYGKLNKIKYFLWKQLFYMEVFYIVFKVFHIENVNCNYI